MRRRCNSSLSKPCLRRESKAPARIFNACSCVKRPLLRGTLVVVCVLDFWTTTTPILSNFFSMLPGVRSNFSAKTLGSVTPALNSSRSCLFRTGTIIFLRHVDSPAPLKQFGDCGGRCLTLRGRIEEVRDKIVPVLRRYDVVHAGVFGSFVRGEMKEGSDIDVLVEFGLLWREICLF